MNNIIKSGEITSVSPSANGMDVALQMTSAEYNALKKLDLSSITIQEEMSSKERRFLRTLDLLHRHESMGARGKSGKQNASVLTSDVRTDKETSPKDLQLLNKYASTGVNDPNEIRYTGQNSMPIQFDEAPFVPFSISPANPYAPLSLFNMFPLLSYQRSEKNNAKARPHSKTKRKSKSKKRK